VTAGERKVAGRMPILRHDNDVAAAMKLFGNAVYRINYLIASCHPEGTSGHEIILHVNDDERISVLYFDAPD
jgi:hypothetical protein